MKAKSLRQIARELGVSPSYLSQVRHGKRPASAKVLSILGQSVKQDIKQISCAEGGIRTHTPLRETDFKSAASTIPPPRLVRHWFQGDLSVNFKPHSV